MTNAAYRKLVDNSYLQQVGNAGGPVMMKIQQGGDGEWYGYCTFNGDQWVQMPGGFQTGAQAQQVLDAYVGQLNTGTAAAA